MEKAQFLAASIVHIVHTLQNGLVHSRGLDRIAVGREEALSHLGADLECSQKGRAWVRVVRRSVEVDPFRTGSSVRRYARSR